MKKFDYKNWRESILHLHDPKIKQDFQSDYYRRLVYDEILSSLIVLSQIRKKIKKIKKKPKKFGNKLSNKII
jgi:ATP-dependent DNA helicase RecG